MIVCCNLDIVEHGQHVFNKLYTNIISHVWKDLQYTYPAFKRQDIKCQQEIFWRHHNFKYYICNCIDDHFNKKSINVEGW